MAVVNQVGNSLTGSTGSGLFVGSIAPTLTQVSFSTTSEIIGTTTNNNAASGSVGEIISSVVPLGSAVSVLTGVSTDVTSIPLTAGDWDIHGSIWSDPAAATKTSFFIAGINTVSNTNPSNTDLGTSRSQLAGISTSAGEALVLTCGSVRQSVSVTTTIYLIATLTFSTSTMRAYGMIWARRAR